MHQAQNYSILPLAEDVWAIDMENVRAFLIAGNDSALLIDTGAGGVDLRRAVRQTTHLPVTIVNTHAHYDHISGNKSFDMIFAHPMEIASIAKAGYAARPVSDGSGFPLGDRLVRVLGTPGHSPGSISLWDAESGLLFTGDMVARNRPVFLALEGASLEAYVRSLDRIIALAESGEEGRIERVLCAHGDLECGMDTVYALKSLAERVQRGEGIREPVPEAYAAYFSQQQDARMVRDGEISLLVS